jgi:tellurite resistance protein TerC
MNNELILWIVFGVIVAAILGLDLGVRNRKAHVIKFKEAAIWSGALVMIALLFGLLVYFMLGKDMAVSYLTA